MFCPAHFFQIDQFQFGWNRNKNRAEHKYMNINNGINDLVTAQFATFPISIIFFNEKFSFFSCCSKMPYAAYPARFCVISQILGDTSVADYSLHHSPDCSSFTKVKPFSILNCITKLRLSKHKTLTEYLQIYKTQ